MSDLIDRQAAIDALTEYGNGRAVYIGVEEAVRRMEQLPSAQPERKRGKWNWIGFNIECSECGCMPCFDSTEPLYNYCPNCGARMQEGEDNERA